MQNVTILVGAQWGDEGKGKWIDILAEKMDLVARYQGGNNAGHTLYVDGQKIVLHQIPSGIFQPGKICALTAGVVCNPIQMVDEINEVQKIAEVTAERLWLSARCHVITPWHIYLDHKREKEAENPIGTTKRGIGPAYETKSARVGLRLGDYVDEKFRMKWFNSLKENNTAFAQLVDREALAWEKFHALAPELAPFVCDAEDRLRKAMQSGRHLLLEGAQGVLLDINHGTYPYVTSSSTIAGGAFSSLGFSPKRINNIYGVSKAYTTRVGEGPFPTELKCAAGDFLAKQGSEFGATTGRPRRCGWLDAVSLRYAQEVNGFDGIILNKMDVLDGLPEIKIATAYEHPELGRIDTFPWNLDILAECQPIYESYPGWKGRLHKSGSMADLPIEAKNYIKAIEKAVFGRVVMVGTGVNRTDALYL